MASEEKTQNDIPQKSKTPDVSPITTVRTVSPQKTPLSPKAPINVQQASTEILPTQIPPTAAVTGSPISQAGLHTTDFDQKASVPSAEKINSPELKPTKQSRSASDNRITEVAGNTRKPHGQSRNILKRPASPTPTTSPRHFKPKPCDSAPESHVSKATRPQPGNAEDLAGGSDANSGANSPRISASTKINLPLKCKAVSGVKEFDKSMKPKVTPRPHAKEGKQIPFNDYPKTHQSKVSPRKDGDKKQQKRSAKPDVGLSKTASTLEDIVTQSSSEDEYGQGNAYQQFIMMEDLVEKLKLLNYEANYCRAFSYKPINRHYFALTTSSGEQFSSFTSLAAWLIQTAGRTMTSPQECDDPNATIATILSHVKSLGFKPDFPPNKLKTGSGQWCIWVLYKLTGYILKSRKFVFKKPKYPKDDPTDMDELIVVEPDDFKTGPSEMNMNNGYSQHEDCEEEEDGEDILDLEELRWRSLNKDAPTINNSSTCIQLQGGIMESTTNPADWELEVERVMPQLKFAYQTDCKDWRAHARQMTSTFKDISSLMEETQEKLGGLHKEISSTMEKISSREMYLNNQLEYQLCDLRLEQDKLFVHRDIYRQSNGGLSDKTRLLAQLNEETDCVKLEIEQRGSSMCDAGPVVRIKQGIARLRMECLQMEVRTGVLQHSLMRVQFNAKMYQLVDDELFH